MIKHSAASCDFDWTKIKIHAAALITISLVVTFNTINASKLNITSTHQNDHPQIGYIYANHRMNNSANATSTADYSSEIREYNSRGNISNESVSTEHQSSETVLRPQLALQIYTSPVGPKTGELQTEVDKKLTAKASLLSSPVEKSRKHLLSSATRNADLWQYDTSDQVRVDPSDQPSGPDLTNLESPYNVVNSRLQTTASSVSPMINAIITLPSGVDKIYRQSSAQSSASGQRPTISDVERGDPREAKSSNNHNGSANVERAIRQLIDSQSIGGNIEFSMNMNGDEIVINPVGRHAASILRTSLATDQQPFVENDDDSGKVWRKQNELPVRLSSEHRAHGLARSSDDSFIISRSLKRHFSSPEFPDDQHSASEIDLVDGNNSSNLDDDNDDGSSDVGDDSRQQETKLRPYKRRATRRDSDGHARRAQTESYGNQLINEQSPDNNFLARRRDEHDSDSNVDNDLLNDPLGEPRANQRDKLSQHEQRRASIDSYHNKDETSKSRRPNRPLRFKQSKRTNQKRHFSEIQSDDNESDQAVRGSAPARQRNDSPNSQRRSEKQPAAIIIKGENVKKFEQLLENLKSLSLNSLAPLGSKVRSHKVMQNQRTDSLDEKYDSENDSSDDEQQADTDTRPRSKSSWLPIGNRNTYNSSSSMGSSQHLARGTSASQALDVAAECDKYRRGHKSQKSASNTVESPSLSTESEPSSTNVVDGESVANSDASDELNDEGSQNIEHEENFDMDSDDSGSSGPSDNQQLDALESDVNSQKLPGDQLKEKPKSLFVRKTILQTYFDTSSSNSTEGSEDPISRQTGEVFSGEARKSKNDYLSTKLRESNEPGSSNRPHATNGHVGRPARDIFDDQLIDRASEGSRDGITSSKDQSSSGYIDYNRLDDREVFRGSESQKLRVAIPLSEKMGPARYELTSRGRNGEN